MQIWMIAAALSVALPAWGVWAVRTLYDTQQRHGGQSAPHVPQNAPAPHDPPQGVRLWVDDGGKYIDGEALHG